MSTSRVRGVEALLRQLKAVPEQQQKAMSAALEDAAEQMAAAIRRAAPRDTGALARSISYIRGLPAGSPTLSTVRSPGGGGVGDAARAVKAEAGLVFTVVAGNDEVYYAHFLEFGTAPHGVAQGADTTTRRRQLTGGWHPGTRAQPFFYPTIRGLRSTVKRKVEEAARAGGRKAAASA